jgi:hypothetical protein
MGQTSLDTTTRYTHNIDEHLRAAVGKLDESCPKIAPEKKEGLTGKTVSP